MGCHLAKSPSPSHNSAALAPADVNNKPPPPLDPRLPLTRRQVFLLSKSWKGISREIEPTGISMFIKLFQENNQLLDAFAKFRQFSRENQTEDESLREHATIVMTTLNEAITFLDNVDDLISFLEHVATIHSKIEGFKTEYFWYMENPFLMAVQQTLQDRYTSNMEEIYKKIIHFFLQTLVDNLNRIKSSNSSHPQTTVDESQQSVNRL